MTHPDDEISICAWIKRLVDNGNCVYMSWTHSIPVREAEGRAAANLLGVPQENLKFWNAPDGDVVSHIDELVPKFKVWFDEITPDRVCCGAFEQGHIDHDATNFVVNQSFKGLIFEIPFYHTYITRLQTINRFSEPGEEEVLILTRDEQKLKRRIAKQYPSQNIWSVLMCYEILQRVKFHWQPLFATERMRLQTHKNFLQPNVPGKVQSRVEAHHFWQKWRQVVEPLLEPER